MNWFNFILAVLTIIGAVLVNYKRSEGFLIWIVTNTAWVFVDFVKGIPEQSVVYIFFIFTAIHGWFLWNQGKQQTIEKGSV